MNKFFDNVIYYNGFGAPENASEITDEQTAEIEAAFAEGRKVTITAGQLAIGDIPVASIMQSYDDAAEEYLLAVRTARGYTTREPSVYRNSTVARWASDAAVWDAYRDYVMQSLIDLRTAYESGTLDHVPTPDAFVAALTPIVWSEA